MKPIRSALLALILLPASFATAQRLTFEVASIHLSKADNLNGGIKGLPNGSGYTAQNVPVKLMIALMYRVPMRQIAGGPDWLDSERFDIEAKTDKPGYSIDDLHIMFQNLLADRFNLKFHVESHDGNIYALTVAQPGSKMKLNELPQDYNIPINFGGAGVLIGKRVPMPYFAWVLGQQLQDDKRPVVDQTGLTGNYDFTLSFAPILPPDVPRDSLPAALLDRPTIFEALKDQLGLKLTAQKGPVQFYAIDHVEKPSDN